MKGKDTWGEVRLYSERGIDTGLAKRERFRKRMKRGLNLVMACRFTAATLGVMRWIGRMICSPYKQADRVDRGHLIETVSCSAGVESWHSRVFFIFRLRADFILALQYVQHR